MGVHAGHRVRPLLVASTTTRGGGVLVQPRRRRARRPVVAAIAGGDDARAGRRPRSSRLMWRQLMRRAETTGAAGGRPRCCSSTRSIRWTTCRADRRLCRTTRRAAAIVAELVAAGCSQASRSIQGDAVRAVRIGPRAPLQRSTLFPLPVEPGSRAGTGDMRPLDHRVGAPLAAVIGSFLNVCAHRLPRGDRSSGPRRAAPRAGVSCRGSRTFRL